VNRTYDRAVETTFFCYHLGVILISPRSLLIYALVWCGAAVWHFVRTGKFQLNRFRFSVFNYYVMMSGFILASVANAFLSSSWHSLFYFGAFAFAGVIGETLVSIWWRLFFVKRFWVYSIETIDHCYTSWLNFVPWAVGGTLYINALSSVVDDPFGHQYEYLWLISGALVVSLFLMQIAIRRLVQPSNHRYRAVAALNLVLFFWPVVAFVAILAWIYGPNIYFVACVFGFVATFAEYLFGKSTEFFISKKMWTYSYLSFDRGHFTPLSVPLFALGGFYFWSIAVVLRHIIS